MTVQKSNPKGGDGSLERAVGFRAEAVYALLIGIDLYLPNPLCEPLHGAVADANAMEAFLRARGVPAANMVKLTASPGRGEDPREPTDSRPTYALMTGAIRRLGQAASEVGGELLIHYSGHGCRTPTLIPSTKGTDGLDEGLVPYDIAHADARILRDVEISYLLAELSQQGVPAVLILDACHSGGILRSDDQVRSRGARCVDPMARLRDSLVAPVPDLETSWRQAHQRVFASLPMRGAAALAGRLALSVSLIAACRDREAAYEFPFDGEIRGALTFSLLAALREGNNVPGWERLQRRVAYHIRRLGLHQIPVFEGEPSGILLGLLRREGRQALRVVNLDDDQHRVLLDAGSALGLEPGARLEVLPGEVYGQPAVSAEVVESDASTAWARLLGGDVAVIRPGDQAFLTDPGSSQRRRVELIPDISRSAQPRKEAVQISSAPLVLRDGRRLGQQQDDSQSWLQAVASALDTRSSGFLERLAPDQPISVAVPDFRVTLGRGGVFEVLQLDGRPVLNLPPLQAGSQEAASLLVDCLIHLARYFKVRDLENGDQGSPLYGSLTTELARLPAGFVLGDDLDLEPCTESLPRFEAGDTVCLSIANRAPQTLHLYVLDLEPNWSVSLLHPRQGLETLPPGQVVRLPFALSLPTGIRQGLKTLKVIATIRPTNTRWLELSPIDRPPAVVRTFHLPPIEPLEQLFAGELHEEARFWRSASSRRASKTWVTDQVDLEVVETAR